MQKHTIEKRYDKFIFTSFWIHNNTKSYFNIASLYSVPADWEDAIFAEISIVKHVELIDAAAPVEAMLCVVVVTEYEEFAWKLSFNTW